MESSSMPIIEAEYNSIMSSVIDIVKCSRTRKSLIKKLLAEKENPKYPYPALILAEAIIARDAENKLVWALNKNMFLLRRGDNIPPSERPVRDLAEKIANYRQCLRRDIRSAWKKRS